jgi:Uma2 family endonuclease
MERVKVKSPATEEDLARMPDDGYKYELVDGAIVASPSGYYHSVVAGRILHLLEGYLETDPVGTVGTPDAGIRLPNGNLRSPDVTFVRDEKLPGGVPPYTFGDFVPDLAVEVLSPSDSEREVADKIGEYFSCGVPLVWLVDPPSRTVVVFRSLTDSRKLQASDVITGDPVLPGFSCLVSLFFERGPRR